MSLDISRITKRLLINEGFFGSLLIGLNKYENTKIPTACVCLEGINIALHINPVFWDNLRDDNEREAVLKHEMLHVGFFHLMMWDLFLNKELANVAMDCEINQYIEGLPKECIKIEELEKQAKITLNRKAGAKYYYDMLNKQSELESALKSLIQGLGDGLHPLWDSFEGLTEQQKTLVKSQIEHQLKEAYEASSNNRGTLPGSLEDSIKKLLNPPPPTVNWKDVLKRYTGGSYEVFTKKTRRKESKRFEGNAGIKVKTKLKGLVCVDTSGSVGNEDLREFMAQIDHLSKSMSLDLLQFDSQFQKIEKYDRRNTKVNIKGRGGTEFDCATDYYNKHKKDYGFMVLFTDGHAPLPNIKPQKSMMWVITHNGEFTKKYPGIKVKMQNYGRKD